MSFTNPVGIGGVLDVSLCLGCGGVCGEWVLGLNHGVEWWGCYGCASNESGIAETILIGLCRDSNHGPLANRANALPLSYTGSMSFCYLILYE